MTDKLVDVIVNVDATKIDRPFQYVVPPQLQSRAVPGSRVFVEFRRRKLQGIILCYSHHQVVPEVKPVVAVCGSEPPLPSDLLELAVWLRESVGCRWVEAMRAVSGPGLFASSSARVSIGDPTEGPLSDDENTILEVVRRRGSTTIAALGREVSGDARTIVTRLLDRGLLRRSRSRAAPLRKTVQVYTGEGSIEQLSNRAARQREVLSVISLRPGTADQIASQLGRPKSAVSRALRELTAKGLAAVSERPDETQITIPGIRPMGEHSLTPEQQRAVSRITAAVDGGGGRFLLFGVTASGKTEVYLRAISHVLQRGGSAFYLVPEIGLTPQLLDVVASRIGSDRLAVVHSRLSAGQRYEQWLRVAEGRAALVIGTRSAIFAPAAGDLIIVDEEHDSSYKQNESPRYHARDAAEQRAADGVLVLGGATPSVETFWRAQIGELELLRLDCRIAGDLPDIELVDMREELAAGNRSMFSRALVTALTEAVDQGEQAVVFVNRRGHSPVILCRDCGFVIRCTQCDVSMVYYAADGQMRCHYCDRRQQAPDRCPRCQGVRIKQFGVGTEKVEAELCKLFPGTTVVRMDADTTRRRGSHTKLWSQFAGGQAQILVGTQMVTKGFDVPGVTVVGAVAADVGLHFPDFRAAERTFQLLTQVVGRSGRGKQSGRGFIQTYNPEHYAIVAAAKQDYEGFYEKEIAVRKQLDYPPFGHLVLLVIAGRDEQAVIGYVEMVGKAAADGAGGEVLGPAPAPIRRIRGEYRWQLLVICKTRAEQRQLLRVVEDMKPDAGVSVLIDVDPVTML